RLGRRGLGVSEARRARSARAPDGPAGLLTEAGGGSRRLGRRGLGVSEARRARSARAPDGPAGLLTEAGGGSRRLGRRGLGGSGGSGGAQRGAAARAPNGPPDSLGGKAETGAAAPSPPAGRVLGGQRFGLFVGHASRRGSLLAVGFHQGPQDAFHDGDLRIHG